MNRSQLVEKVVPTFEPRVCALPGCANVVVEPWEESGTLCARCALDRELWDRDGRRERAFQPVLAA
jgi:hypothetical protein